MEMPTSTTHAFRVCCPLEEETLETLPSILVNPLVIPAFGRDDGHHGLDFSYFRRGSHESIGGIAVYAILSGTTALILPNEIPYGNTIVIETSLSELPESLQEKLQSLYQPVPEDIHYQGECPEISPPTLTGSLSVYHLYAHLENSPSFQKGDLINCGVQLGTVGNSGRSSNPHLHLETRLGPSGADLGDMAFYETKYTEAQRANYCLWRMSGYFQLFDPYLIFNAAFCSINRVKGMLHIDESGCTAFFLTFCNNVLTNGGFSRGFRAIDLRDPRFGDTTYAQGNIE